MKIAMSRTERIKKICLHCHAEFYIQPSRDWREHCCSSECKTAYRDAKAMENKKSRKRSCRECGDIFYPRQFQLDNGKGAYCSIKCSIRNSIIHAHSESANAKRGETFSERVRTGEIVLPKGENNPRWTGGSKETTRRRVESGKSAKYTKKYRKENPDKAREFSRKRKSRILNKLPYGTIPRLRSLQKNKCAICRTSLEDGDHLDHIMPLAKGGKHVPSNLQLLCPSCNVRKSAKHPVDYMQEIGMLL